MTTKRTAADGGWTDPQAGNGDGAAAGAAAIHPIGILDTVEIPIMALRRSLTVAWFNKAAADVLGLSPSDNGRSPRDIAALSGLPRLEEQCGKVIAEGVESRVDFRDGYRWFVVRISAYPVGDGQVTGVVLTFTNVTASRASVDQAIYEREFTKAILNTVADPLVVLGADQRVQSANRAFHTLFGLSRDETQGVPLHALGGGAFEIAQVQGQLAEMMTAGHTFRPVEVDCTVAGKVERTLVLDAHPLFLPGHSERRILVTFQDITSRKQAEAAKDLRSEEELRRSEAQLAEARRELQLTIDTIPAMVATFRSDGERDFVNKTWRDYFSLTSQETARRGQAYVIRVHPEDAEAVGKAWRASLAGGQPFHMEMRILGNDGRYRWHTVRRVPLRNESGDVVKWYGVMVDIEEQKAAENALRRSEAFLAEAQRLSLTGSFSWRLATGEITWSEELYRIFEFDQGGSVTIERIGARVHPEDAALFNDMIDRARGADLDHEYRLLMPDRSIKYLHVIAHGTPDKDGRLEYIGAVQDVTQRRMSEEALRASETNLRKIIDSIPGQVCTMNAAGQVELLSRQVLDYFGKTPENLKNWQLTDAVHHDDLPGVVAAFTHSVTTGEPYDIEHRCRRADGVYRWFQVRARAVREADGRITGWYVVLVDIDDRKRAEDSVKASERQSRLIVDTIPGLVAVFGPHGEVEELNRQFLGYLGRTKEEFANWAANGTVHPDDLARHSDTLKRSLESGIPIDFETRLRRFDGVYRWVQILGDAARDASANIVRWYCLMIDIDERKRAEDALGKARSELTRVTRISTLSALTASIAHEVNQPLSGIVTNAGTCLRMLAADPPNVGGARETARRTIRDGNRAADVIARLRALFGKKAIAIEPVDLNEAVREVIALSRGDLERGKVTLRSALADVLPLVGGDRVQLQQVILNLMRNAAEAMSGVDDRPRRLLIMTEQDQDDQVRLSVRDAGVGFGADGTERLFEAFYTTKNDGMGIGLSVSRSIIQSHNGRLWAVPNDGPGATFAFCIPRWREDLAADPGLGSVRTLGAGTAFDPTQGARPRAGASYHA